MSGFEPLIIASLVASTAGTALAAEGAAQTGKAQYTAAMVQSQISTRNAQIARANAVQVVEEGRVAENDNRAAATSLRGTQRAVQAGLGQLLDTGSAGAIVTDTGRAQEVDAQRIRYEAQKQALGLELQAQDFTTQGQLDTLQGKSAFAAGKINAFSTILTGAGQIASMKYDYNKYKTSFKGV